MILGSGVFFIVELSLSCLKMGLSGVMFWYPTLLAESTATFPLVTWARSCAETMLFSVCMLLVGVIGFWERSSLQTGQIFLLTTLSSAMLLRSSF